MTDFRFFLQAFLKRDFEIGRCLKERFVSGAVLVSTYLEPLADSDIEMREAKPTKRAPKRKATTDDSSGNGQESTKAVVKQPAQTKGAIQKQNYRLNHPGAAAASSQRAVVEKKIKRAEKPSASYKRYRNMLVMSASHGQEDRQRYPKGSACLGMALTAVLYPVEVLKWTVPTLHQIMEDGYTAYRRIMDANSRSSTDFLEVYEANALEEKVSIEGRVTHFQIDSTPYSGQIGQQDVAIEPSTSGLSLVTALRRFFANETAGILLVEPFWVGIRRSDLDGIRYAVVNTHSVTMGGKIPDATKMDDWVVWPTAKIHTCETIEETAEIIKAGTNGTLDAIFMIFAVRLT